MRFHRPPANRRQLARLITGSLLLAAPAAQAAADGAAALEEITVTARKREENLQDAPVSVTAFSESALELRSATSIQSLAAFTPNLEINSGKGDGGSTNAAIFIRGVGQNDFIFPTDPGVGLYVDGVYIARSIGGMLDLADVQRIEVLRGPQGTLYGKNTIGGAINVITTRPGNEFDGKLKATMGSDDRMDFDGRVNLPLLPGKLAAKLAASSHNQDGWVERAGDGLDLGDTGVDVVRGALAWTPTEALRIDLSADYSSIEQNGSPGILRGTFSYPGGLYDLYNAVGAPLVAAMQGMPPGSQFDDSWVGDENTSYGTGPSLDDNETWGLNLTATWDIADTIALKSITAWREMDAKIKVDMDYSPFPVVETDEKQDQEQFSQEFQLSGDAFGQRLNWLAGAYYMREKAHDENATKLASGIYDSLELMPGAFVPLVPGFACPAPFPAPCAGGAGNPYNTIFDLDVSPTTELETDSWALFAQGSWQLTDKTSLTLGGRYSWDDKEYFISSYFPNSGKIATPPTTETQSWSKFTPKIGLDYQLNDDVMLYASWSKGFKSGGWNPRPLAPSEFRGYDPETLEAWETGIKTRLFDNRMSFNVAAFYSDYKDVQLQTNTVDPNTGSLILSVDNAGEVELYGFEAEIVARPAAGLDLNLAAGYLHNEYDSLDPSVGYSIDNVLPRAPKLTLSGGVQYRWELGGLGSLTARLDASYRSKTYFDPQNSVQTAQESYTLLNSRISWADSAQRWEVALYGTNLNDEDYFTSAEFVPSFGFYNGVVGRPREWGLAVSLVF